MSWISDYGVDWYREYYENKEDNGKVNPVRLIAEVWSNSDKIGFDCKEKNDEWKGYFDECGKTAVGVEGRNAKVVRVLKPTVTRDWKYYVPIKSGGTSWVSNRKLENDLKTKHRSEISSKGKLGELVVETCDHKKSGGWIFVVDSPESTFCRTILEKFFGAKCVR